MRAGMAFGGGKKRLVVVGSLCSGGGREETLMRYRPKSSAALHIALSGLPEQIRVEVDPDIKLSAATAGELREVTARPQNLLIPTLREHHAGRFAKQ
jgi:hypothetical protein